MEGTSLTNLIRFISLRSTGKICVFGERDYVIEWIKLDSIMEISFLLYDEIGKISFLERDRY